MRNLAVMQGTLPTQMEDRKKKRDFRVDACRGFALIMILIDHTCGNYLIQWTMLNFGFCDASELFVLLSGYAVWLAYGRLIDKPYPLGGWRRCIEKISKRWVRIYLFHFITVVASVLILRLWTRFFPGQLPFIEPEILNSWLWLRSFALLRALPQDFNILQLYCTLLAIAPIIFVLQRINTVLLLVVSASCWLIALLFPWCNFHNDFNPIGWFFNPLGWQFIFVVGMLMAVATHKNGGNLQIYPGLRPLCVAFLIFACLQCYPFSGLGLPPTKMFNYMIYNDKTTLGVWRCLDAACIMYLLLSSKSATRICQSAIGQILASLGRNSLEVFCFGTMACIMAGAFMNHFGGSAINQFVANVFVFTTAFVVALIHDRLKWPSQPRLGQWATEGALQS